MCLIPAEIIPRSDVDDAERNVRGKRGAPSRSSHYQAGGCPFQEFPAWNLEKRHENFSRRSKRAKYNRTTYKMCKAHAISTKAHNEAFLATSRFGGEFDGVPVRRRSGRCLLGSGL